jgi:hypothetical protein
MFQNGCAPQKLEFIERRRFPIDKEVKQGAIIALHFAAGLFALSWALYYLLSDALPFSDVVRIGSNRTKATICAFFFIAAYMLLSSAGRYGRHKQKAIGYFCIALGFATVWLVFEGSSIDA